MLLVAAMRHRRERAAPRTLHAPGRCDEPHAVDSLDRAHHVETAQERPPARAGLVHEGEAVEPGLLLEGRRVDAELAAVQLEPEHAQPVPQSKEADEARLPGAAALLHERDELAQPPERSGIE